MRIACTPLLVYLAYLQWTQWFFLTLCALIISDYLDGWFARTYNNTSELGAQLDSVGDILSSYALLGGIWFLWPEKIIAEKYFLTTAVLSYLIPFVFHSIKFKTMPSFHTTLAKLTTMLALPVLGLWIFLDFDIAIKLYCLVVLLVSIEYSIITSLLDQRKTDVVSAVHLIRQLQLQKQAD